MTDQRPTENDLEEPEQIRDDSGQRSDGRPTDPEDPGRPAWDSPEAVPTVAPEEEGGTPSTEHGPGGSL
jgi:hypothetical protein